MENAKGKKGSRKRGKGKNIECFINFNKRKKKSLQKIEDSRKLWAGCWNRKGDVKSSSLFCWLRNKRAGVWANTGKPLFRGPAPWPTLSLLMFWLLSGHLIICWMQDIYNKLLPDHTAFFSPRTNKKHSKSSQFNRCLKQPPTSET